MIDDRKKNELMKLYAENIREAFSAHKETGVYINCEFKVDLARGIVQHSLSSTNGEDVVVIQKDIFKYDNKFKKNFLEPALMSYVSNGTVTVIKSHDHSVDSVPSNSSTLKSVTSANNILNIKNAEIDYIKKIVDRIEVIRTQGKSATLRFTNGNAHGIIDALVLAFLVGTFGGVMLMIILKFIIR